VKSNDKEQSNHTNSKDGLLQDKTGMSTIEETSTQNDGFRYDYDDSSDL
jgi:hypothetical protein